MSDDGGESASLVVAESSALKTAAPWAALAVASYGMLGVMGYLFGMMGERIMCTKNGCKGHGDLVRSVALILCKKHEAAIEREPVLRALLKLQHRAENRSRAFMMAGKAKLTDKATCEALELEDQRLEAALAWSKDPDAPEGPVVEAAAEAGV